jgi:heptaprenyl diphosphate synthase
MKTFRTPQFGKTASGKTAFGKTASGKTASGKTAAYKAHEVALLGAFCLFLSSIEYLIPKPLPFMRLGLANLPLLLGIDTLPFPAFLTLVAIKTLGQALITGTLFSYVFLFSAGGTLLSGLVMFGLRRACRRNMSFVGICVAGATASNAAQLFLAWAFVFRESVRYIAPPFLAMGLVTGIALGAFAEYFARHSRWYAAHV